MNKQHYEREPNFQHMNLAFKKKKQSIKKKKLLELNLHFDFTQNYYRTSNHSDGY